MDTSEWEMFVFLFWLIVPAADSGKLKLAKMQTATDMNLSTQFQGEKK